MHPTRPPHPMLDNSNNADAAEMVRKLQSYRHTVLRVIAPGAGRPPDGAIPSGRFLNKFPHRHATVREFRLLLYSRQEFETSSDSARCDSRGSPSLSAVRYVGRRV